MARYVALRFSRRVILTGYSQLSTIALTGQLSMASMHSSTSASEVGCLIIFEYPSSSWAKKSGARSRQKSQLMHFSEMT
jgi:hypothetical protein